MHKKSGFTLIEILIVVAILAILTLTVIYSITHNLANSRDARRKADLERLKIAMEDYYGDKNIYPPDGSLGNCESEILKPYLSSVPCDPKTKLPYCYIYDNTDPKGQTYKILASFENEDDSAIASLGCEHSSVN
jgi:general secretion pathway protein G